MVRSGSGKTLTAKRKRTRKLTKGFRLSRHNLYRQSIVTLIRAREFAFRDRQGEEAPVPPTVDRPDQRGLPHAGHALQ